MPKKSNIARKFGYTFAGEAYALAVSLLEDGRETDAFMALRASIAAKDAKILASELSSRNEFALVEAGLKKADEEIEEEEVDDESVLASLEEISAFIEASSDDDSFAGDEEKEVEYSEDEDSDDGEDDEDDDMEEDDDDDDEDEEDDEDDDNEDDESEDELEDEMFGEDEDEEEEDKNNEDEDDGDIEESEYDEPELEDDEIEVENSLENFEAKADEVNKRLASKREKKRAVIIARAIANKASLGKRPNRQR